MRLIGMLDSPYVRRTAISLTLLERPFSHEALSVFRSVEAFNALNPVVKAPTLITDDGLVLMDSSLILEWAERGVDPALRLTPADLSSFTRAQRLVGLALVVCEKAVQSLYERKLRPDDKQYQPWLERIHAQLETACRLLEHECAPAAPWLFGARPLQADVSIAVAWRFVQEMLPDIIAADAHPHLASLSAHAEATPAFLAWPFA